MDKSAIWKPCASLQLHETNPKDPDFDSIIIWILIKCRRKHRGDSLRWKGVCEEEVQRFYDSKVWKMLVNEEEDQIDAA